MKEKEVHLTKKLTLKEVFASEITMKVAYQVKYQLNVSPGKLSQQKVLKKVEMLKIVVACLVDLEVRHQQRTSTKCTI
jgi:hypothetical protein